MKRVGHTKSTLQNPTVGLCKDSIRTAWAAHCTNENQVMVYELLPYTAKEITRYSVPFGNCRIEILNPTIGKKIQDKINASLCKGYLTSLLLAGTTHKFVFPVAANHHTENFSQKLKPWFKNFLH